MTQSPLNTFSDWLSEQLLAQGLSAKEFAAQCGISEATVSRIRSGKHRLTPTMRRKVAMALKCDLEHVPHPKKIITEKRTETLPTVRLIHTSDTPVAMLSYAEKCGIFSQNNIFCKPHFISDFGSSHITMYRQAIAETLARGQPALAIGCKDLMQLDDLSATTAIYSHTAKNLYLATRTDVNLPLLDEQSESLRMVTLKHLLELMNDGNVWPKDGRANRISWQENADFGFIAALQGMANELCNGIKYHKKPDYFFANKQGLQALHSIGDRGVDFFSAGVTNLAQIYAHPARYKILLQDQSVKQAVASINPSEAPGWAEIIKKIYQADKRSTALARFRSFWLAQLSDLETPYYWHIFWPETFTPTVRLQIEGSLTAARDTLHNIFASATRRELALREIYLIINEQIRNTKFDFDSFLMDWTNIYDGL